MADYLVHKAVELSALSKAALAKITEDEWVISPKYDGCHVIFLFQDGEYMGAISRTGEVVRSMAHIALALPLLYSIDEGNVAICGEAWQEGKEFNEISGAFRRHTPQPQLQFVPFDVVPWTADTSGPVLTPRLGLLNGKQHTARYLDRLGWLCEQWPVTGTACVIQPKYVALRSMRLTEAYSYASGVAAGLKARTNNFYDGAVLAQGNGLYKVGSGKGGEFIKCKPLLSYSVKVGAVIADVGGKTGKATCVLCFDLDGHIQKVSTGLTQEQAEQFTSYPNLILDKTIEVEAMGKTVNGFLREPRFKGIRDD